MVMVAWYVSAPPFQPLPRKKGPRSRSQEQMRFSVSKKQQARWRDDDSVEQAEEEAWLHVLLIVSDREIRACFKYRAAAASAEPPKFAPTFQSAVTAWRRHSSLHPFQLLFGASVSILKFALLGNGANDPRACKDLTLANIVAAGMHPKYCMKYHALLQDEG
jgi:hypothetical protein